MMCQLLGISISKPVDMVFSFREWSHKGSDNPDGYGFAYWPQDEPVVVKEPRKLARSSKKARAAVYEKSRIFVCHVRLKSAGPKDGTNTHPFDAQLGEERFVFAHNGTVDSIRKKPLQKLWAKGKTDSEHAFLWMLEQLESVPKRDFSSVLKRLADDIRRHGRFNFLLSDGQTLWAYADDALHFVERKPPFGGELVSLCEDGYTISLTEVKAWDERAVLVATQPLSNEEWERLDCGTLLEIRDGAVQGRPV